MALGVAFLLGMATVARAGSDPIADHLERGRAYLENGEYAKAVLEFEQVLRFDNLPPDLRERAEIYARAARDYQAGKRMTLVGYAETGGGQYREGVTDTTDALGVDPARDWFWKARAGGGLSRLVGRDSTLDASLDYTFRHFDDAGRPHDSDLFWNTAVIRSLPGGSRSLGVRGWASYRGRDGYRQDYGLYLNRAVVLDPDNEILVEGEIRARRYPAGEEREGSRDIGEVWLRWTRALADGTGALTLTVNGGRELATHDRPGGDQNFHGAQFDWSMAFGDRLGVFLFGLWQHNRAHEDVPGDDGNDVPRTFSPNLDSYELSFGLTCALAPGWSLRPEVLYLRDDGNTLLSDYSATEIWITVRKSF
jgi:tetratricopeptide (TPR) repeat protein